MNETKQIQRVLKYMREERRCTSCESLIQGRRDKRFCDYRCKNHYHSVARANRKKHVQVADQGLHRNHQVVMEKMGAEKNRIVIHKRELTQEGFDFNLCTGFKNNAFGSLHYIYNYYWFERPHNKIEIRVDRSIAPIPDMILRRWATDLRMKGLI